MGIWTLVLPTFCFRKMAEDKNIYIYIYESGYYDDDYYYYYYYDDYYYYDYYDDYYYEYDYKPN